MGKLALGILASGSGTNLQAILEACSRGEIGAETRVVISDNPTAMALERAKRFAIATAIHERSKYKNKREHELAIVEDLKKYKVELVCLAGYMRIIGKDFLEAYPNKIINIHPALLPSFPGLDAQKQAFDHGVKIAGCTVHFVDEKVDHGLIILQTAVPVMENDTAKSLREQILKEEHKLYPKAIGLIAHGRITIQNRKVKISC